MKLDRINDYILATTVLTLGIVAAVVCGHFAGEGENTWLWAMAGGIVYAVVCLALRSRVWILIPMFWPCAGQLNSMPGHLPLRDLIIGGIVVYFFTLKAFKVIHTRMTFGWLDAIMGINLLYLLSVYLRFPIGVEAFGSDMVGGRAYLEIIFALGGYWILSQVTMSPGIGKIFPLLLCAVSAALAVVSTITYMFPSTVPILGKFYSGIDAESYQREQSDMDTADEGADRAQYLAGVGTSAIALMTSYFSPLKLINPMYFWRFLAMVAALFLCAKSGHRITVPSVLFTFFIATYFRKGVASVVILSLLTIPLLVLLIAGQGRLYQLPDTAQRTLSIFPGEWDPDVLVSADDSTEWRVQMWDIMLHDKRYINDKVFGDGFGFSKEILEEMSVGGDQDLFMATNSPHSGPVSTIRVVGFIGLGLFLLLLFGAAIRAWRVIRATKGGPFFPVSLFIGIQIIYGAIGFVFIFGDYKNDLPSMIMNVGLLNLISNGLGAYRKGLEEQPPPPVPVRSAHPLAPMPMPAMN